MITEFEVDGIRYNVEELPANIRQMVALYDIWTSDAEKARAELDKAQIARNYITEQIISGVRSYNAELVKQLKEQKTDQADPAANE